jgi:hypothetical protein
MTMGDEPTVYAFPITAEADYLGMTLRDYFAAKAMQGWLTDPTTSGYGIEGREAKYASIAEHCYAVADAMLAERAR